MRGFQIFTLANIPVFVSPMYLLLLGYYAFMVGDPMEAFIWIAVVTVSLLVHEFGHALVSKHYDLEPQVLLHGFGGLCMHKQAKRDLHDVWIIIAGPGVGIAFALLVGGVELGLALAAPHVLENSRQLTLLLTYSWYVGFVWNFVNLVPLWPLDGGQLFRLGAVRWLGARRGEQVTHILGIVLAVVAGIISYRLFSGFLMPMLCLFLGWENYSAMQRGSGSGPVRRRNKFADELYQKAQVALEAGDWREAARLGHQIRAENNVPDKLLDKVWELLSISTARQGEYEEALGYLKRAPRSPMVVETHIRSLATLGRSQDAQSMLASAEGQRLPEKTRRALEDLIEDKKRS